MPSEFQYQAAYYRYERTGQNVVPVLVQGTTLQGKFVPQRIIERAFPSNKLMSSFPAEYQAVKGGAVTSREQLLAQGVLQTAEEYPREAMYLPLDEKGRRVAVRDAGVPESHGPNHQFLREIPEMEES